MPRRPQVLRKWTLVERLNERDGEPEWERGIRLRFGEREVPEEEHLNHSQSVANEEV